MPRIKIDGKWIASDFSEFYAAIDTMHAFEIYLADIAQFKAPEKSEQFGEFFTPLVNHNDNPSTVVTKIFIDLLRINILQLRLFPDISLDFNYPYKNSKFDLTNPNDRIIIKRCSYASPGFTEMNYPAASCGVSEQPKLMI
jgi:hypothetical protein